MTNQKIEPLITSVRILQDKLADICRCTLVPIRDGTNRVTADWLFAFDYDPNSVLVDHFTDPHVVPSPYFKLTGSHAEFLGRLLPPGLNLPADEMSAAALQLAVSILNAMGSCKGPMDEPYLSRAISRHAQSLDKLKRTEVECYALLIQARLGEALDCEPRSFSEKEFTTVVQNHALFMVLHAAKMVGMLSAASQRNTVELDLGKPGETIKIGGCITALSEKALRISDLLANVPSDLSGEYHQWTIYSNGVRLSGVDLLPLARSTESKYNKLPKIYRNRFRRELGRIVANVKCDAEQIAKKGRVKDYLPIPHLAMQLQVGHGRRRPKRREMNGHTHLLTLWTGYSPVEAVAIAAICVAFAFKNMSGWVEARRTQNGPKIAWPRKPAHGYMQIAYSVCEVLRTGLTKDKDVAPKKAGRLKSAGQSVNGPLEANVVERSADAGRSVVERMVGVLNNPSTLYLPPMTILPEKWFA